MRVGVPTEIKTDEYRVALTPAGARELIQHGHEVLVETTAGDGSAFPDEQYERAGARIVSVDDAVFHKFGFERGTMRLVEIPEQKTLLERLVGREPRLVSGGLHDRTCAVGGSACPAAC